MAKTRNQDFLRGTDRDQKRIVELAAAGVAVTVAAVLVITLWVYPRYHKPSGLALNIEVPYVGPGVGTGTKVILHGAEIGEVTGLEKTDPGTVRMSLQLQSGISERLTDDFDLDFRPQNYFGISAVDLIAHPEGDRLVSGSTLDKTPTGDFTMSTMLEKGSLAVDGTLTQSMVTSLNKVIRYTDGLTPLIQSGIVLADRVAATQQALPTELMRRADDILAVMPAFGTQAIDALYNIYNSEYNRRADGSVGVDDAFMDKTDEGLGLAANSLFGKAGHLLASHGAQLTPVTQLVAALTDVMPHMLGGGTAPGKVMTLIDRYNAAFTGSGGHKTLNLRIIVDDLPMFATPLALTGIPTTPAGEGHR
ncbi:Mce family protein [Nocardia sp. CA2R105]|uniref:Mce family protein n=1 Tax=Nocardia coffeae TaxID=2873381 RepID=UPI001CA74CB0|nr:Mce family protein [Nocardia coffeae]MBY8861485.1 Mce family protein [Nocardia coffeae]